MLRGAMMGIRSMFRRDVATPASQAVLSDFPASAGQGAQAIAFCNVSLTRDGRDVLRQIDFRADEARIGILGLNGSGKSTLLRLMIGLVTPTTGTVTIDGLNPRRDAITVRNKTGFLFQTPDNQIVCPIVEEDLAFGLKARGLTPEAMTARIMASLTRLGIADLAARRVHEL